MTSLLNLLQVDLHGWIAHPASCGVTDSNVRATGMTHPTCALASAQKRLTPIPTVQGRPRTFVGSSCGMRSNCRSEMQDTQQPPAVLVEAGTQTQLATGASALVAAAREEILRLRELNQRLLDRQSAGN